MRSIRGIVGLTLKSAFRNRLIVFILIGLALGVVLLPTLIEHDETAKGFTQIVLSYTLSFTVFLLGIVTLAVSCGSLAKDIEDCQMQMVAVKPVERWKIWLGKWLGVMAVNLVCVIFAGAFVFISLMIKSKELSDQEYATLKNEVLVARGVVKPPPVDVDQMANEAFNRIIAENDPPESEWEAIRKNARETVLTQIQLINPGYAKLWTFDFSMLKNRVQDKPLYLRVNFQTSYAIRNDQDPNIYRMVFVFGSPESEERLGVRKELTAAQWHTIEIPPGMLDDDGILHVEIQNYADTSLLFPIDESLQTLYPEGGFTLNYARGLVILLCWLALITTLGLTASSFLSFPVAAFFSISILVIFFSGGLVDTVVENNTIMGIDYNAGGKRENPVVDAIGVPFFKGLDGLINMVTEFSPVESLSSGRSVSWFQLLRAIVQIVFVAAGILGSFGIYAFARRELAKPQNSS